jgi:hypothetical protein
MRKLSLPLVAVLLSSCSTFRVDQALCKATLAYEGDPFQGIEVIDFRPGVRCVF